MVWQNRMKLFLIIFLFYPLSVIATVCRNSNGTPTAISYDLTKVFSSANNTAGQVVTLRNHSQLIGVTAICPVGTTGQTTLRSYVTQLPITKTIDGYQFIRLNDYLEGAMSIRDDYAGQFFPPIKYLQMGVHPNVPRQMKFPVADSNLIFKINVTRRLINEVVIPPKVLFNVYVTTTRGDPLTTVVYTISYSGIINVPQTCVINTGTTVTFNFGDMAASLFSRAGAYQKPPGVNPQWKSVSIKCNNINANALLTMRVEAANISGNAIVSDNPDLGFVVVDENSKPLTPNNLDSIIPFKIDEALGATLRIGAWPISITGKKPKAGSFSSFGYLRVDYF